MKRWGCLVVPLVLIALLIAGLGPLLNLADELYIEHRESQARRSIDWNDYSAIPLTISREILLASNEDPRRRGSLKLICSTEGTLHFAWRTRLPDRSDGAFRLGMSNNSTISIGKDRRLIANMHTPTQLLVSDPAETLMSDILPAEELAEFLQNIEPDGNISLLWADTGTNMRPRISYATARTLITDCQTLQLKAAH